MAYFFDTSAVVKRYVVERGSGWINGVIRSAVGSRDRIQLASITRVELVAAIARRRRSGAISTATSNLLLIQFRRELVSVFRSVAVTYRVIGTAMELAEKHALRGYDATQLAAALRANSRRIAAGSSPLTFISADLELNAAAVAEGLAVDDPNSHP